jgi:hypothetical protein
MEKAQLDDARTKWIIDFVGKRVDASKSQATGIKTHAAMLDLTAVSAIGGESVWFYRRVQTRLKGQLNDAMSFLFAHQPNKIVPGREDWWPVAPQNTVQAIPEAPAPPSLTSEVTMTSSASTGPEDEARAIELELVRIVVKDFVQSFKSGQAVTAPPPTASN